MSLPEEAREALEEGIEQEQERKKRERREATKWGSLLNDEDEDDE